MYGYRIRKGVIVIHPDEAEVVHWAFRSHLDGVGVCGIARTMRELGISSYRGGTWTPKRVLDMLKNEKYAGNALLQKKYVADHLTKSEKLNHGELPKYYAEDTHSAIVSVETFLCVQAQIERNRVLNGISKDAPEYHIFTGMIVCDHCGKLAGRQHNGTSCFSGKIICGCCGGIYGSKVWHSTDKYRRVIWQCNAKFKDKHKCDTPHLTEDAVQQKFLKAFEKLLIDRDFILEDTKTIIARFTATEALDAETAELREEIDAITELVQLAITQNASMAIDQQEYERRYSSLSERFYKAKERQDHISVEIAVRKAKRDTLMSFSAALTDSPASAAEFMPELWNALVDQARVSLDGEVQFAFKNGAEITV